MENNKPTDSKSTENKPESENESLRLEYAFEKGINFKDRIIQLTGEIDPNGSFDYLDAALTEMERTSKKAITIKINSEGGSAFEALAMVDRIRESKCQIITKAYGMAQSAAGLILAAGDKRYIGANAWFMYHESIYGLAPKDHSSQIESIEQAKREESAWATAMAKFTNQPVEFWESAAHKSNFYLDAEQCLLYGVVDGII